jgi:uncharacterized protein YutE (UPF0331/DUF86 family)
MEDEVREILFENLSNMENSLRWLRRSYKKCLRTGIKEKYTEEEFDDFENLTSRYARTADLILQKVFRSIDAMELEDSGTLIDAVNRAEKRGLIDSGARIRELKDLRNEIVHEYEIEDLKALFRATLSAVPDLFEVGERIKGYCRKFGPGKIDG